MKITQAISRIVEISADNYLVDGIPAMNATREFVTLELFTDEGLLGIGITCYPGPPLKIPLTAALKATVDALLTLVIGENPFAIARIIAKLIAASSSAGPAGIIQLAIAAIDIALWDLKAKASNLPLAYLLGGYRDRAPTYASGAMLRHFSLDDLAKVSTRLVASGFKQIKLQLGATGNLDREVERVKIVREAIGNEIDLMADINQRWDVHQAMKIGRELEKYHLFWLEDIINSEDYEGLARIAEALTTPIAGGEYQYGLIPFRNLLVVGSLDIIMIDVFRVGGITQWLKVAGMAEAFNLSVVSHLFPEIHVHLMCAIPNGLTIEYWHRAEILFAEKLTISEGELVVPQRSGLGLTFDRTALDRYQVESSIVK
jgi:L-alanine-DL-glutamate epimerase-like enolase superfamily enzyme